MKSSNTLVITVFVIALVPAFALASSSGVDVVSQGTTEGMIILSQEDVGSASGTTLTSAQVVSNADFVAYAQGVLHQNPYIQEIDVDTNSVVVKYAQTASVFGIFPVTMTAQATVGSDGSAAFSYPWYSFVTSSPTDGSSLGAPLSAEATTVLNRQDQASHASEGATWSPPNPLSPNEQAKLLSDMIRALSSVPNR
jgi:hypothetical protein